jgi:hypothetical protein
VTERSGRSLGATFLLGLRRGAVIVLAIAAVAETIALLVWAVGRTGMSLGDALAFGWLELGAVHHVAIHIEIRDVVTAAHSRIDLTIGFALLAITVVAAWRLAVAASRISAVATRWPERVVAVAGIALGYTLPFALVAPWIDVESARASADLPGVFGISLVTWQAFVFPLAIAAVAASAGAWWRHASDGRTRAAASGVATMTVLAFALSFVALFAGGVVVPDGAIALTTPTTARYVRAIEDRPVAGPVSVVHHVALAPVEATWAFVPAMGGCVVANGTIEGDLLCYDRFPTSVDPEHRGATTMTTPVGAVAFERAPAGYLAFLLVPLVATVLGGRRAARGSASAREAVVRSSMAGVVFALVLGSAAVLSRISVGYAADLSGTVTRGSVTVGPSIVDAAVLGALWGVAGGALGAFVSRWERS